MTMDRHIRARWTLMVVGALVLALVPVLAHAQGVNGTELIAQLQKAEADHDLNAAVSMATVHGVPPALLRDLTDRGSERGVDESVLVAWVKRLDSLARRGLPVSPVVSRYLEGLAKAVPPSRIDLAVDELEGRMVAAARRIDARYAVSGSPQDREARLTAIDHGAYVLSLGISETHMDRSLALAETGTRSIEETHAPILTLGILVASGIAPEKSIEVIDMAWNHGYRGASLERLGKALGRLGHDGEAPPVEVVEQVLLMIGNNATQETVFEQMDDLNGRDGFRIPGLGPGEDPTIRRGDTDRDSPDSPSGPTFKEDNMTPIDREGPH